MYSGGAAPFDQPRKGRVQVKPFFMGLNMTRKIEKNVFSFLDKASKLYGNMQEDRFSQEMYNNFHDIGLQSPIEDMFWVAAKLICEAHYNDVNPDFIENLDKSITEQTGIYIWPQYKVGKYKVDFLVYQNGIGPEDILSPVIVELDGHQFHDKDKHQRSYEKARDRYFVKQGYKVVHYTGSDVVKDPFKVAHEVLSMVGCYVGSGVDEYDAKNPLSLVV
jgi:very-short-patch-repair endonuclease